MTREIILENLNLVKITRYTVYIMLCISLFLFRKSIYKGTPNFIHFNLALSLLIGLIFFVSAIETAKENEVRNTETNYFFINLMLSRLVVQQLQ